MLLHFLQDALIFYGYRHLILFIFYSTLLGLGNVLGSEEYWPVLVSLTAIPAVLQFILLLFLPESPRLVNFQNKINLFKIIFCQIIILFLDI